MGARADWFIDDAVELDLRDDVETLKRQLDTLLRREGALDAQGVRCGIRDRDDSHCSACPLRNTPRAGKRTPLCEVGVAQERTVMRLVTIGER